MFSNAQEGDRVFDIRFGPGTINTINAKCRKPILVEFDSGLSAPYFYAGFFEAEDCGPTLYWSRPEIIAPPPPKRKVKKSGWVNVYPGGFTGGKTYPDESRAALADDGRVACAYIEWEEDE